MPLFTPDTRPTSTDISINSSANNDVSIEGNLVDNEYKARQEQIDKQLQVEESTQKFKAFIDTWDNTFLSSGIDTAIYTLPYLFDKDEEFKKSLTRDKLETDMKLLDVPMFYMDKLSEADTEEQYFDMIATFQRREESKKFVSENLNSYNPALGVFSEASSASLVTGLLGDVDTLLIPLGVGIASKAGKLASVSFVASAHTVAGMAAYESDASLSLNEAVVFSSLGVMADGLAIGLRGGTKTQTIAEEFTGTASSRGVSDAGDSTLLSSKNDAEAKLLNRAVNDGDEVKAKASELFDVIDDTKKDGTLTEKAIKAREELKSLGYDVEDLDVKLSKAKTKKEIEALELSTKQARERVLDNITKSKKARESSMFKGVKPKSRELMRLEREAKIMGKELEDFKMDIAKTKAQFRDISLRLKNNPQDSEALRAKNEYQILTKSLRDEGYITKSEYDQIMYALNTGKLDKLNSIKGVFKKKPDGTYELQQKNVKTRGKKTAVPKYVVAGAILGTASSVFADDGLSATSVGLGLIALLGGVYATSQAFRGIGRAKGWYKDSMAKLRNMDYYELIDSAVAKARTSFLETYAPLIKDPNKEFRALVRKLIKDTFDGTVQPAERIAADIMMTEFGKMQQDMNELYTDWIKENGYTIKDKLKSGLDLSLNLRREFGMQVTDAIEGVRKSYLDSVNKAVEVVNATKKRIHQRMVDAGVDGIEDIKYTDTYMQRISREEFSIIIRETLAMAEDGNIVAYTQLVDAIEAMLPSNIKNSRKKAEAYLELMANRGTSKDALANVETLNKWLKEKGINDLDASDITDMLGVTMPSSQTMRAAEQIGITKKRVPLDFSKWRDFEIELPDGVLNVTLDTLYKRDAMEIMNNWISQASGYIALAEKGLTPNGAYAIAVKGSGANAKAMEHVINEILGIPIVDGTTKTSKVLRTLRNYTTALLMSMSSVMLAYEAVKLLGNLNTSALISGTKELARIVTMQGKSELRKNLTRGFGIGMHKDGLTFGAYNTLGDANMDMMSSASRVSSVGNTFVKGVENVGEMARDAVLYPLVAISDFLSYVAMSKNLQVLLDVAQGKTKLHPHRSKAYGIDDEVLSVANKYLSRTKSGEIAEVPWDKMTEAEKAVLRRVVWNMNHKDIQMVTIGGTPSWSRSSDVGLVASHLLKFPMEAFANQGLFDLSGMAKGDFRSFINIAMGYIGSLVAVQARALLKGEDLSNEELHERALLMMPLSGFYGAIQGAGSPAVSGAIDNAQTMIGVNRY